MAALTSDAENLYTLLSAKTLNPQIRAIARASTQEALKKLQRAGADAVVSPYITGGKRMAAAALRPQVMDFVDGILTGADRELYLEEVRLDPAICPCIGQTLREARLRSQTGALILAIRRTDGNTSRLRLESDKRISLSEIVLYANAAKRILLDIASD